MATPDYLSGTDELEPQDLITVWSRRNRDSRRVSVSQFTDTIDATVQAAMVEPVEAATAAAALAQIAATDAQAAADSAADAVVGTAKKSELAASTGLSTIGYAAPFVGAISRSASDKASERKSVLDDGAPVDGITPAHVALQKMATRCDTENARYFYVPNWKENYQIGAPIVFTNPGVRIFGDQGATYNRGAGKLGWFEALPGIGRVFDLGNSRTTGNPADQWEVSRVSLKNAIGTAARSVDGFSITSKTDGPDRGIIFDAVSIVGMKSAITTEYPSLQVVGASVLLMRCVITQCGAIFEAKGNVLGFSMRHTQAEQNIGTSSGLVRGAFSACITIEDNMLEGQSEFLSVDIGPTTGNRPIVTVKNNYLESNSGKYFVRLRCSSALGYFEIGPNYAYNVLADDYVLFEGENALSRNGAWRGFMRDEYPVVFKNTNVVMRYGSEIFCNGIRTYGVRQLSGYSPEIIISNYKHLSDPDGSHIHVLAPAGTAMQTPYGPKNVLSANTYLTVPVSCAVGDLLAINLECFAQKVPDGGSIILQIFNQDFSAQVVEFGPSAISSELLGRWALVSRPFRATAAATSLRVRLFSAGNHVRAMSGLTIKNYGSFADDGVSKVLVTPVTPNIA